MSQSTARKRYNSTNPLLDAVRALPPNGSYEIWGTKDVADFLHVGIEEVRRLVDDEGLPYIDMHSNGYRFLSCGVVLWAIMNQRTAI